MNKFLKTVHILGLMVFVFPSGLFAATNVIDNFNSGSVASWWTYGTITRSAVTSPAIGGYSMKIAGSTAGGYYIGGTGLTLSGLMKNLSQCTSLRIYLANMEGNNAPDWGWDKIEVKVQDDDGTQVTYPIQPFTSSALLRTNIRFPQFTIEIAGSIPGMDWSKVNCIMFQINSATSAGSATNVIDEIAAMGSLPAPAAPLSLDVRIQPRTNKTWDPNGISQITFPSGIDTSSSAPAWLLSDSVILVQFSTGSNHAKLLFYTDNKNAGASPKYGGDDQYGGLIGQTMTNTNVHMIWSLFDERISDRTNFHTSWSNTYKSNKPLLPSGFDRTYWTNRSGPYISGYWRNIIEIGSTFYSWNGVGQYECVIAGTNNTDQLGSPQNAPLKGTLQQNPQIDYHGGAWTEYMGPFGGWWANDNYKSDMSKGIDGKGDVVIYLAASFRNKPIQNYKSNRIIIELCHEP
jgi:hypothetical protein